MMDAIKYTPPQVSGAFMLFSEKLILAAAVKLTINSLQFYQHLFVCSATASTSLPKVKALTEDLP